MVSRYTYLCSLTFSLKTDEAASAWRSANGCLVKYDIIALFQHTEVNLSWIQTMLVTYFGY